MQICRTRQYCNSRGEEERGIGGKAKRLPAPNGSDNLIERHELRGRMRTPRRVKKTAGRADVLGTPGSETARCRKQSLREGVVGGCDNEERQTRWLHGRRKHAASPEIQVLNVNSESSRCQVVELGKRLEIQNAATHNLISFGWSNSDGGYGRFLARLYWCPWAPAHVAFQLPDFLTINLFRNLRRTWLSLGDLKLRQVIHYLYCATTENIANVSAFPIKFIHAGVSVGYRRVLRPPAHTCKDT